MPGEALSCDELKMMRLDGWKEQENHKRRFDILEYPIVKLERFDNIEIDTLCASQTELYAGLRTGGSYRGRPDNACPFFGDVNS